MIEAQALRTVDQWGAVDVATQGRALLAEQVAAVESGDVVAAADCDGRFHRLLCSYTRNQALRSLANGLIENARTTSLAVYALPDSATASLRQHNDILTALEAGKIDEAAQLVITHHMETARASRTLSTRS